MGRRSPAPAWPPFTILGPVALAGLTIAVWLAWRGAVRSGRARELPLGGAVLVVCAALVTLARRDQILELRVVGLWAAAVAVLVRIAFGRRGSAGGGWRPAPPAKRAVLFINPRSGGGKAARVALADEAASRGIEPVVMRPGDDLGPLARAAVDGGADAPGMAGGDGSQGLVAAVAAAHRLPFVCVPVGTRNHLALDLGVDATTLSVPWTRSPGAGNGASSWAR